MPKFRAIYYFDGKGSCIIDAKDKEEAEKKYRDGDFEDEEEQGQEYQFDHIEEA